MASPAEVHADEIFRRYQDDEFEVDVEIASSHTVRESVDLSKWNDEGDGYSQEIDLATIFTNALTDYKNNHDVQSESERCAIRLGSAYDLLRNYGAIIEGMSVKSRMAQKDRRINVLETQVSELTKALTAAEDRAKLYADENTKLENRLKEADALRHAGKDK